MSKFERVAARLGVTPEQLREAIIAESGWPESGVATLSVRVHYKGVPNVPKVAH